MQCFGNYTCMYDIVYVVQDTTTFIHANFYQPISYRDIALYRYIIYALKL